MSLPDCSYPDCSYKVSPFLRCLLITFFTTFPVTLFITIIGVSALLPSLVFAQSARFPIDGKALASKVPQKPQAENSDIFWVEKVQPLLDRQCLKCHAGVRQRGGLDLRSLETTLRGGDSGPAIIPGKPDESRLLKYVAPAGEPHMPPDPKRQLTSAEIATLKSWITQLPVPKSKKAAGNSTDNSWVTEYMADYRRSLDTHPTPPANLAPTATIDWYLRYDWQRDGITPAPLCDDTTFVRRIYLDLVGRIPSREERQLFLADKGTDKRQRLIAKLIDTDDYARYMREIFDVVLMGRPANNNVARERNDSGWNAFLENAFRTNKPWSEIVRSILVARPAQGAERGSVRFLSERKNSYQAIAEAVAPVVFGVQIKCAQCHNHPITYEIEQRHYWGLVAVFNRSKNVDTDTGPAVSESAIGGFINFANLKKESQPATLVFLNGKSVPEKIPAPDTKEVDSPDLYLVPPAKEGQRPHSPAVPRFSRREAFAEAVTHDNPALARAFVNRVWASLMGRGFVQPLDEMESRHRPAHPELLEWLSQDFERSHYDVKRLVTNIVQSHAYQLDAHMGTHATGKPLPLSVPLPRPEAFARALEKPLTAEQLLRSLWVATGTKPEDKSAREQERAFAMTFPDVMPATYSPSLQQALFLSNSPIVDDLLKPAPGNMVSNLLSLGDKGDTGVKIETKPAPKSAIRPDAKSKLATGSRGRIGSPKDVPVTKADRVNETRVREAFDTVLGRAPDATELLQCTTMLKSQAPESGVRNLLWALLTCAEFQVNH